MVSVQAIHNGIPLPIRWVVNPDTTGFSLYAYIYSIGGATSVDVDVTLAWFAIGK
jgi:hypothetical protein